MVCDSSDDQARIDRLFADPLAPVPLDLQRRLLNSAKRGVDDPASLSVTETQEICYALVVHYAQMGIA